MKLPLYINQWEERKMCRCKIAILVLIMLSAFSLVGCTNYNPAVKQMTAKLPAVQIQEPPGTEAVNAVLRMLNENVGWLAINSVNPSDNTTVANTLFLTKDSGVTWVKISSLGYLFKEMQYVNEEQGWALGTTGTGSQMRGVILITTDGGKSWTKQWEQAIDGTNPKFQLQFLNPKEGYALIGKSLLATSDGGESWVPLKNQPFSSFSFVSSLEGWACDSISLWHTVDGGHEWKKQWSAPARFRNIAENGKTANYVDFISPSTGWALFAGQVTEHDLLQLTLRSTDKGDTWMITNEFYDNGKVPPGTQVNPAECLPLKFVAVNEKTAFYSTATPVPRLYPRIYRTDDKGKTWHMFNEHIPNVEGGIIQGILKDFEFISSNLGWAAIVVPNSIDEPRGARLEIFSTKNGGNSWYCYQYMEYEKARQ